MQHDIFKLCADSLRILSHENYETKLKAAHAHELVAAFLGYKSKNAMLADTKHPLSNLDQAEIVVMIPDEFIDERRDNLQGWPSEQPDNYMLGEAFYERLFSQDIWVSPYPPFRSFDKAAKYLVENNDAFQAVFKTLHNIPMHHVVTVQKSEEEVVLNVLHAYEPPAEKTLVGGKTTIKLPRVAGHIGFGKPKISVEQWTAGARRTLKSLGV